MSMSTARAFRTERLSERAAGYGMPGVTVDGNDLQAVHDAVATAVARARAGAGPSLVEALTYRWRGHSKSDKNLYRTREEIEAWRGELRDPIARFEAAALASGALGAGEVDACRARARDAVRSAVRAAYAAPDATADGLVDAVYAR